MDGSGEEPGWFEQLVPNRLLSSQSARRPGNPIGERLTKVYVAAFRSRMAKISRPLPAVTFDAHHGIAPHVATQEWREHAVDVQRSGGPSQHAGVAAPELLVSPADPAA